MGVLISDSDSDSGVVWWIEDRKGQDTPTYFLHLTSDYLQLTMQRYD